MPVSTNSILIFDLNPFRLAIAAYLVNIAHNLLLFRPLFHIYYTFEFSFPTRPSLFKIIVHAHTPPRRIQYSYFVPNYVQHNLSCKNSM